MLSPDGLHGTRLGFAALRGVTPLTCADSARRGQLGSRFRGSEGTANAVWVRTHPGFKSPSLRSSQILSPAARERVLRSSRSEGCGLGCSSSSSGPEPLGHSGLPLIPEPGEHVGQIMVTGATGGIGYAVVAALSAAGHHVSVVGRDLDRLRPVPGLRAITADLAQPQLLAQAVIVPRATAEPMGA